MTAGGKGNLFILMFLSFIYEQLFNSLTILLVNIVNFYVNFEELISLKKYLCLHCTHTFKKRKQKDFEFKKFN